MLEQRVGIDPIRREAGDADADAELDRTIAHRVGVPQLRAQGLCNCLGGGAIPAAGKQHHEFVATQAGDEITFPQAIAEPQRDIAQQPVAMVWPSLWM